MDIRITGTIPELNELASKLRQTEVVKTISKVYPNRDNKSQGRLYVTADKDQILAFLGQKTED